MDEVKTGAGRRLKSRKRTVQVSPATSSTAPSPRWLEPATWALSIVCLLGLFSSEAHDTDFWWHLKTGQYIMQNHRLPVPDPFAYTTALNRDAYPGEGQVRHFNLTHEWLSQLLIYLVYWAGGLPLVTLVRAGLLTSLCGLAGFLAAWRSKNFYVGIASAFAAAAVVTVAAVDRPMILTFVFVALFLTLPELRRALWVLPCLAFVWANCHGGFFMGWVVLLAYCGESLVSAAGWRFPPAREILPAYRRRLWLVTAGAIAASALNPNGLGVLSTLFHYRQSTMTASLIEWQRPYLWGEPYAFDLLLYGAALALIVSWRKVFVADWLLFAAFATAALMAFRNVSFIGILAPVLIATYFPFRLRAWPFLTWTVPIAVAAVLATGIARGSFFQLRPDLWRFPVGAADYLLANHISGPLFNTYEHGGYLIWRLCPQYQVFIDGRAISESTHKDYSTILNNPGSAGNEISGPRAALLNRYGINAVVMNTFQYNTGTPYALAMALANPATSDWQLVYDDAQSLIFVRHPAPGTPVFPDKLQRVIDHMETECSTNIQHSRISALCARTLADLYLGAGETSRARDMLRLYLNHAIYADPEAERALRQLGGAR